MADIDGGLRGPAARDRAAREVAARRTLVGMVGTAAVVVVGLGSLAIAGSDGGDARPGRLPAAAGSWTGGAAEGDGSSRTPDATTSPEGWYPVVGDDGAVVGYLRPEDERAALDGGEPPIRLGTSQVAFRGLRVVDASGVPVGWFLSGDLGFVGAEEVADPAQLAEIEATWLAEHPDAGP